MDGIEYFTTKSPVGSKVIRPQGEGWQMASMSTVDIHPRWLPARHVIVTTWVRYISQAPAQVPSAPPLPEPPPVLN